MINPCKDCTVQTGRSSTCHATCEKYKAFRAKWDEIRKARVLRFEANSYIVTTMAHRKDARNKRRKR